MSSCENSQMVTVWFVGAAPFWCLHAWIALMQHEVFGHLYTVNFQLSHISKIDCCTNQVIWLEWNPWHETLPVVLLNKWKEVENCRLLCVEYHLLSPSIFTPNLSTKLVGGWLRERKKKKERINNNNNKKMHQSSIHVIVYFSIFHDSVIILHQW